MGTHLGIMGTQANVPCPQRIQPSAKTTTRRRYLEGAASHQTYYICNHSQRPLPEDYPTSCPAPILREECYPAWRGLPTCKKNLGAGLPGFLRQWKPGHENLFRVLDTAPSMPHKINELGILVQRMCRYSCIASVMSRFLHQVRSFSPSWMMMAFRGPWHSMWHKIASTSSQHCMWWCLIQEMYRKLSKPMCDLPFCWPNVSPRMGYPPKKGGVACSAKSSGWNGLSMGLHL